MRDEGFRAFVEDQLAGLGDVDIRAMFGGYGIYHRGAFFGIIYRGTLYFKTNDATRPAYTARGMKPFKPSATQTLKNYYEVPADILEDPQELVEWARAAAPVGARRPGKKWTFLQGTLLG